MRLTVRRAAHPSCQGQHLGECLAWHAPAGCPEVASMTCAVHSALQRRASGVLFPIDLVAKSW
eukprot:13356872-Alexandrium_andersonii.AAC.1